MAVSTNERKVWPQCLSVLVKEAWPMWLSVLVKEVGPMWVSVLVQKKGMASVPTVKKACPPCICPHH